MHITITTFTNNDMDHNNQVLAMVTDLDSQKVLHYEVTTKKYDLIQQIYDKGIYHKQFLKEKQ